MKFTPKPFLTHRETPAIRAIVTAPVPREAVTRLSYHHLVTSQNVHPDRAKQILGLSEKNVVAFVPRPVK